MKKIQPYWPRPTKFGTIKQKQQQPAISKVYSSTACPARRDAGRGPAQLDRSVCERRSDEYQ